MLTETNGAQAKTYTYDSKGNTLSEGKSVNDKTDYTWDDKGRLLKAVIITPTGTKTLEYQYNENNIRVSQKVDGVETRFLVDPNRDYAQVLEEYNPINGTVIASYVYGLDLISQNRGGAKSFYLYDGLGSVRALTDASGVVTDRYNYDAYGNNLSSTGSTANSYRYAGEQFDSNLKDYYLRDRYYGSDIGRFTRSDSFEGDFNQPLSLNKYIYTHGNPVNGSDPSGKMFLAEIGAAESIRNILAGIQTETGSRLVSAITNPDDQSDAILSLALGLTPIAGAVALPVLIKGVKSSLSAFGNLRPDLLATEISVARNLGVTSLKIGTSASYAKLDELAGSGEILKWAVSQKGELLVIPKVVHGEEISHAVLTNGQSVLAAGEAALAGSRRSGYYLLEINNHSGHFQPHASSLAIGKAAFKVKGVNVEGAVEDLI